MSTWLVASFRQGTWVPSLTGPLLLTVFPFFPSQTMVHVTNSGTMLVDDLKLFLHGLPPDCQESTLTDFLEGTRTHQLLNCWEPLFP